jgi:hypothetical protein
MTPSCQIHSQRHQTQPRSFLLLPILYLSCLSFGHVQAQTSLLEGQVSYVSSLNVYVKFSNTEAIGKGDTLYGKTEERMIPLLVVKDKSSTSCVCAPLSKDKIGVGDRFFARLPQVAEPPAERAKPDRRETKPADENEEAPAPPSLITPESEEKVVPAFRQKIRARLSAATYSTLYGDESLHRMRYAFNLQGSNLRNSRFSTDNYIVFRHTVGEWQEVKDNLSDALKIYALSISYDLDAQSRISLGRRINPRFTSLGAIDGLHVEKGFGQFLVGGVAGSRPDIQDYGVNPDLKQAGLYVGHQASHNGNSVQSTFGVVEQRNGKFTDRRFVYFQHASNLWKKMNLFGSFEVDLYENIQNEARGQLSLTNLYLSARYRLSQRLSVAMSFDSRRNIIYYESYKSYIDQLIDNETRQGLRFNISYRPFKRVTWGASANWRFQKSDANLSRNLNTYLNFTNVPGLKAQLSVNANILQTNYMASRMMGVRLNKDLIAGKLNLELYGRHLAYTYRTSEFMLRQEVAGANLGINLSRKLSLYLYGEATFDSANSTLYRVNTRIIQRL